MERPVKVGELKKARPMAISRTLTSDEALAYYFDSNTLLQPD